MIQPTSIFISEISSKLKLLDLSQNDFSNIKNFPLNAKQCIYVIDWQEARVSFQKDIHKLLGYTTDEFTLETLLNIAHPDDLDLIKRVTQAAVNHLTHYTCDNLKDSSLNLTYRFRKKDNTYVKILRQSSLYEPTRNGKMKSNLSLLTDISFFDNSETVHWEFNAPLIEQKTFKREIYKEFNNFFTRRETEIIKLISSQHNTKSIAQQLFISEHTVYSHRKNILKKSKCHNATELIAFCHKTGVL
ncbi:LuxR C-terminal-related transcriptional regulator [Mariniflexile sp. AS56]|uniref:LuxR C-terminal-related transcriptional regulator n=1 Tax=Mariniflexile sp. AS56 TaxID=3063957 RepID=UPI0026EA7FB6|nr:LuxR C-terminal-related transcriptional regulator [Mariniflexile sp. AS56]MDO7171470.1 LuxR C-terminal-related transcriptional regulator [Mariniflexile sp. AS56]